MKHLIIMIFGLVAFGALGVVFWIVGKIGCSFTESYMCTNSPGAALLILTGILFSILIAGLAALVYSIGSLIMGSFTDKYGW